MTPKRKQKILEILDRHRIKMVEEECFIWRGCKTAGYGRINFEGKSMGAHRAAWMSKNGKISRGHYVRHTCNNKLCTNPLHLFLSSSRGENKTLKNSSRVGRERLSVDLPTWLIHEIRKMASKYEQTITKYVGKRLHEVIMFERRLDKEDKQ